MNAHPPLESPAPDVRPAAAELALLVEVIRTVARNHRLRHDEVDDFSQSVHLRLLHRNYDIFARFGGRSSLRTYLTVVVVRLLLDWRNSQYGKWRPSKEAQRLGRHATMLERLMSRDRLTASEAIHTLTIAHDDVPAREAEQLVTAAAQRPRRQHVGLEVLDREGRDRFVDPVEHAERELSERRLRASLSRALRKLSNEDREIVAARYAGDQTLRALSESRASEPKATYRRLQSILQNLRRQLTADGFERLGETA